MYSTYYFYNSDGVEVFNASFHGNAHQRRVSARMIARATHSTYKVWSWRRGSGRSTGSFNK